ncbi:hypothetical protein VYL96_10540 [Dietzia cinnamea]|nr:hypothetical protein [Dietzia cinnamea]
MGPMETPNRIVLRAMDMNVSEDGEIEQREIDHYVARAAGGAGLIITGACAIAFPVGAASLKEPGLSDDKYIPGLKALADAVHAAGSKLCPDFHKLTLFCWLGFRFALVGRVLCWRL